MQAVARGEGTVNRWGLWASGVGGAIVAAVAWGAGIPPTMFWGMWAAAAVGAIVLKVRAR